jgi:hypothetical protein
MPRAISIAKGSYTPRSKGGQSRAHAGINYAANRPDAEKGYREREGFSREQDHLSREELHLHYDDLSAQKYDYRLALSPNPELQPQRWQESEWREFTRDSMQAIEERHGPMDWVAVHHNDPDHPHVHVYLPTEKTLNHQDLKQLREAGYESAQYIHDRQQSLERDPYVEKLERQLQAEQARERVKEQEQEKEREKEPSRSYGIELGG